MMKEIMELLEREAYLKEQVSKESFDYTWEENPETSVELLTRRDI